MNKLFVLAVSMLLAICTVKAAEPVTLSWSIVGVESTQSKVVFDDFPVKVADGAPGGQWVLNSSAPSYAKTSTTWVTTGNAKTLQLGSGSVSPVGTSVGLSSVSNPIPANARISAVEILVKSLSTESVWSVSVNGVKAPTMLTAASAVAMDNCTALRFDNLNMAGNIVSFAIESIATSGRYVYVAGVNVEYTADAEVPLEKVATPEFLPASGASVESGSYITLSCATEGADIFYATGAGAFTPITDGRFKIEGAPGTNVNVRAYAAKDGMTDSEIATAVYTLRAPAVEPPFEETFASQDALGAWTIVDADNDGSTWKYYNADKSVFIEHQIGNKGKNDWLFTPALSLDGASTYTLRFNVRAGNASYPEKIAVAIGAEPTAEAMTNIVMETAVVDYSDYRTITCDVAPSGTGVFYIGFQAASDAGMFRLFVDDIRLSAGKLSASPAAVSGITVVNNPDGANTAEISLTAPSAAVSGAALGSLTKVEVKRNGALVKTFDKPHPGSNLSFIDEVPSPAEYRYSFAAFNEAGEGADTEVKAFVGINIPSGPTDVVFAEPQPGTVSLSWTAPSTTVYGDFINPSLVKYTICDSEGNTLATDVEGTQWQAEVVEAGAQALLAFKVFAATAAGTNEEDLITTDKYPVGTPYELPYEESFTHWTASKLAEYITPEGSKGLWRIMRELLVTGVLAYDADDGIMAFMPEFVGDKAIYRTGKIMVPPSASNPMLSFRLHNALRSGNVLTVGIEAADGTSSTVEITPDWGGWKEQLVSLKDFAGKEIRISFTATAGTTDDVTALDLIRICQIEQHDLAVGRFRMPLEMELQRAHRVVAEVVNIGMEAAAGYTVDLYCDGEKVASKNPASLARNESASVEFNIAPESGETPVYKVVVSYEADADLSNNKSEPVDCSIIYPLYSPVENLTATVDAPAVTLTWEAPAAAANTVAVTETFERYDEFSIDTAGEWAFYDVDQGYTYGINDGLHSFPNMGSQMAYIVFNGSIPTLDTIGSITFGAHSGNQYLASFSIQGGEIANDDWLISPRLNGSAQTVSFFIRSMSIGAHEKFEFLYSTTGKSIENFVKAGEGENYSGKWTSFEFNVPEGTQYFAIRCVTLDQYAFFLDDITYIPATSDIDNIVGYDIYRDGAKLNDAPVATTSFTDVDAVGSHTYQVYAVMPRGLAAPAEVSVEVSGHENVSVEGENIEVYNLQGHRIAGKIDGLPSGIYIIRTSRGTRTIRL